MNTKALLWAVLFGFAFVLTGAEAQAAQEQGRITARGVKGKVTVRENGADPSVNAVTVVNDKELRQNMTVTTEANASVVLIFANGAIVNLGSDSVLNIKEFTMDPTTEPLTPDTITTEPTTSKTKIELTKGELVGKVAKLKHDQGSEFTVGTPVGAAGIRGTTFRIVYKPGANGQVTFSLTTLEGNVEVTVNGQVAPVAVGASQEVVLNNVVVNIDATTGAVSIVMPVGTSVVTQQATAAALQVVLASVTTIVDATTGVTITPTGTVTVVLADPPPVADPVSKAADPKKTTTPGD